MTAFSKKERLKRAMTYQEVDRLPTQINYTHSMGEKLAAHLGVSQAELPTRLDNHLLRVELDVRESLSPDGSICYDGWGVGWSTQTEGYWPVVCPLAGVDDLDAIPWPDPDAAGLLEGAARAIAADGGQRFVAPNFGFALYERAWSLRGFEQFNMDLALNPDFAEALLERITVIQERLARRFLKLGVDGGYFGDDYGAQKGMLFSPATWRALFKPRLARLFGLFRQASLPVILHSDGDIARILPDLLEIGLTMLNPVQPEVHDLPWLHKTFNGRLAFYGGVSTQSVLPYGAPDEVRQAVQRAVAELAPDGSGLLLAPSHRLTSEVPLANIAALLEAIGIGTTTF
jgi:uroporphyrinogen decarboxylase